MPRFALICKFIFTGRRYDPESELYFYRARYYSPELGRFISRDPKGYVDGPSLYEYVMSKPLTFSDPHGKQYDTYTDPSCGTISLFPNTLGFPHPDQNTQACVYVRRDRNPCCGKLIYDPDKNECCVSDKDSIVGENVPVWELAGFARLSDCINSILDAGLWAHDDINAIWGGFLVTLKTESIKAGMVATIIIVGLPRYLKLALATGICRTTLCVPK